MSYSLNLGSIMRSSIESRLTKLEKSIKLLEAKQVGTLYHVCTLDAYLNYIYPKDTLSASGKYMNWLYGDNKYVSFTRDQYFVVETNNVSDSDILLQIVVDGDKLSENYKTGPYNDFAYDDKGNTISDANLIKYREKEEVVKGPIKNISKYIKNIYIDARNVRESSLDDLKKLVDLHVDAKYFNFIRNKSPALKGFIKTNGLKNGDSAEKVYKVFSDYVYSVASYLYSGDIKKIEKAMLVFEDNLEKLDIPYSNKGPVLNFYCNDEDNYNIVNLILSYGADPNAKNSDGTTPMFTAAANNCVNLISLLRRYGGTYNTPTTDTNYTPIMYASKNGATDVVEYLLEAGANPTVVGKDGKTAFSLASNGAIKKMLYIYGSRR